MVTVSLCKKGGKNSVCCSNSRETPSFFIRVQSWLCYTNPTIKPCKTNKQKITRLCSFVNLGWTSKLHICWFIVVDVPVAGVHCVEDHINGLTHLFFSMLANVWGLGNVLRNVPQERRPAGKPWKKYVFVEVTEVAQTLIGVCVLLVALRWRLHWNSSGFGNKRDSWLWSRHRSSYPRRVVLKMIFPSKRTVSVGGEQDVQRDPPPKFRRKM